MKKIMIFLILLSITATASQDKKDEKKARTQKQIQIELEKEKKYAKEQKFYMQDNYDFKGAEVNPESVKHLPPLEVDDLDMDSVYD